MANHKSAKKRIRSSKRRTNINKRILSSLKACQKTFTKSLESKNKEEIQKNLNALFQQADRAVKKNVIKPQKASRTKSRFATKAQPLLT